MDIKKRNINIDLIKCIAVFSVISIHFFANANFYNQKINNNIMYMHTTFRCLFMICVPLFLITTGYLMNKKSISKKYYLSIIRVLLIYLLTTISVLIYYLIKDNIPMTIKYFIKGITTFDTGYSWYIEMYLGLFLIIPFINLIYHNLKNKKEKKLLIITMLIITSLPGIANCKYRLIPDWYMQFYPLTYYFIGCYLSEYKININKYLNAFLFIISVSISGIINILLSYNDIFLRGIHNDWPSILNVVPTTLIFIFILNLDLTKAPHKIKKIIYKISELSLGTYLMSCIIDNFLYFDYYKGINFLSILGYFKIVPLTFILSLSLSMIINVIYKMIDKYIVNKLLTAFIKK